MINTICFIAECQQSRSLTPIIAGPSPPPPGLTVFQDQTIPCPAVVLGVSFYASGSGSFWLHVLRPSGTPITHYTVVLSVQAATDSQGLHHVTFGQETSRTVQQDDVLAIQDTSDVPNSLAYVTTNELMLTTTGGLLVEGFSTAPALHFSTAVLVTEGGSGALLPSQLHLNASTTSAPEYPPLRLHMEYGIVWLLMRGGFFHVFIKAFDSKCYWQFTAPMSRFGIQYFMVTNLKRIFFMSLVKQLIASVTCNLLSTYAYIWNMVTHCCECINVSSVG